MCIQDVYPVIFLKMIDIFDHTILCKKCNVKMNKIQLTKDRFILRAVVCPKCNVKIIHPADQHEHDKFTNLKNKEFRVKMRLVGNSYAVSIPKEIVSFIREQERVVDDMVRLCFEDFRRLSLNFSGMNGLQNRNHIKGENHFHEKMIKEENPFHEKMAKEENPFPEKMIKEAELKRKK